MLWKLFWRLAALNVLLNTFIDKYFGEFILCCAYIELSFRFESVIQGLIIFIQVEVKLSKKESNQLPVRKRVVCVK